MQLTKFREKYNYNDATPVIKQFLDIKFSHLDCLLLFRMGDFYELLYEDAEVASRALNIALTKRQKNHKTPIPMCGVPYHALTSYLHKLLLGGFKVAICDQKETPEEAKKRGGYKTVVRRDVTRIITPGTIIENELLSGATPNYLASIVLDNDFVAICKIDLSTFDLEIQYFPYAKIKDELKIIFPKEIIVSEQYVSEEFISYARSQLNSLVTFQVDSNFAYEKCKNNIVNFYKINNIESIGNLKKSHICALGSLLMYLEITQKQIITKLPIPKIIDYDKVMHIDGFTWSNLEIVSSLDGSSKNSLFSIMNKTVTKAGSRMLYKMLVAPSTDLALIQKRLQITEFFYNDFDSTKCLRHHLQKGDDIERILARIVMKKHSAQDLLSLKYTIICAENIRAIYLNYDIENDSIMTMLHNLTGYHEIFNLIDQSIEDDLAQDRVIKIDYHDKIKNLNVQLKSFKSQITEIQDLYRKQTNVDSLKIIYNNILGFFVEVTSKNNDKISNVDHFIHRQTTVNAVRYTTTELINIENNISESQMLLKKIEQEIYDEVSDSIIRNYSKLIKLSKSLSALDVFSNLGYIAREYKYSMPVISNDMCFSIQEGRHPVVERVLAKGNKHFVTNQCSLSYEERIWIITGPNMAGKSTFLRQNAIIAIMAHIGSFVPAVNAYIGVIDRVFSRVGANDNLANNQSTFMLEMTETAAILNQATYRSLIILDEVGRGTSTYDGVSIASAVLEYIHDNLKAKCLFATHYHEITDMSEIFSAISNYTISVEENKNKIVFLHNIIAGTAKKSYGICVAQLAGLPNMVIAKARSILDQLESKNITHNNQVATTSNIYRDYELLLAEKKELESNIRIINNISSIDPNAITPIEALEKIYELVKECQKITLSNE